MDTPTIEESQYIATVTFAHGVTLTPTQIRALVGRLAFEQQFAPEGIAVSVCAHVQAVSGQSCQHADPGDSDIAVLLMLAETDVTFGGDDA
jgi:hypothetical protein